MYSSGGLNAVLCFQPVFRTPRSSSFGVLVKRTSQSYTQKNSGSACAFFARGDLKSCSSALRKSDWVDADPVKNVQQSCAHNHCRNPFCTKVPNTSAFFHTPSILESSAVILRPPSRVGNRSKHTILCCYTLNRVYPFDIFVHQQIDLTFDVHLGTASFPASFKTCVTMNLRSA